MTETYSNKAYLALFNLLDSKYEKSRDTQLGRLLGDMNPILFVDDTSADSACFEDFSDCCASYPSDEVRSAYKASIDFLKMYDNEFGFEISGIIEEISFEEYEECFRETCSN